MQNGDRIFNRIITRPSGIDGNLINPVETVCSAWSNFNVAAHAPVGTPRVLEEEVKLSALSSIAHSCHLMVIGGIGSVVNTAGVVLEPTDSSSDDNHCRAVVERISEVLSVDCDISGGSPGGEGIRGFVKVVCFVASCGASLVKLSILLDCHIVDAEISYSIKCDVSPATTASIVVRLAVKTNLL